MKVGTHDKITVLVCVLVAQSCPTLWDPMDCSPPGSSVHGIFQARILESVAIPSSNGSSWPRDWIQVSCIAGELFAVWAAREAHYSPYRTKRERETRACSLCHVRIEQENGPPQARKRAFLRTWSHWHSDLKIATSRLREMNIYCLSCPVCSSCHSRPSWLCAQPQLFASSLGLEHCCGTDEPLLVMWMGAGNKREVSWVTGVTLWIHLVSTPLWMPSQLRLFNVKEK